MIYFWKALGMRISKTIVPSVWHANTQTQLWSKIPNLNMIALGEHLWRNWILGPLFAQNWVPFLGFLGPLYILKQMCRRPHTNRVRHSYELYCSQLTYIVVLHYPPWLGKKHLNRVRHLNHSQARRALGSRRPHSNRVSTSTCDKRLNCIVLMSHILV